jgi:hypothetical protein
MASRSQTQKPNEITVALHFRSKMKAIHHLGSRSSAVVVVAIIAVAGLILNILNVRMTRRDGSQQVKEKPAHASDWALEIAGNAAAAFLLEMESDGDNHNGDNDILLSVPAESPQAEVVGIKELMEISFWGKNTFCEVIQNLTVPDVNISSELRLSPPPTLPVVVNFTFGCKELFKSYGIGTGNWLSSF